MWPSHRGSSLWTFRLQRIPTRNIFNPLASALLPMDDWTCQTCGANLGELYRDLESRARRDIVETITELSIWAGRPPGPLRSLRVWLRKRGILRGGWWNRMTCRERSTFLGSHLIPAGKALLFPEPVATFVIHTEWDGLNGHMRNELDSIRG